MAVAPVAWRGQVKDWKRDSRNARRSRTTFDRKGGRGKRCVKASALHEEPWNALSVPTWAVHVSSVVEYLVAMGMVWRLSEAEGKPRWKNLTWAMLFLHCSSLCACVYHVFYNAKEVEPLVLLQAALTFFGNCALAWAAYRIWRGEVERVDEQGREPIEEEDAPPLRGFEDLAEAAAGQGELEVVAEVVVLSFAGAFLVKYGCLLVDFPFQPSLPLALALVLVPTGLNAAKWRLSP